MADHISSTGETCDRCRVASAEVLYLSADSELTFCGHHAREYHGTLVAQGFDRYELALPDVRPVGTSAIPG